LLATILTLSDLEQVLVSVGAVKTNDSRLSKEETDRADEPRKIIKVGKTMKNDEDDWD
jgi:hypothetical protein